MKCYRFFLFYLLITNVFFSCKQSSTAVELKNFANTVVKIEKDSLIAVNISSTRCDSLLSAEYKLVVYMDSLLMCSSCWTKYISYLEYVIYSNDLKIRPIYIFDARADVDVNFELNMSGINLGYFIDYKDYLKRGNKNFPKSESLKTFLTKNDTVLVAGNPFENSKMTDLYLSILRNK